MARNRFAWVVGVGCTVLILLFVVGFSLLFPFFEEISQAAIPNQGAVAEIGQAREVPPTLTVSAPQVESQATSQVQLLPPLPGIEASSLAGLYEQLNPGVVNVQVYIERETLAGGGAGSGFILDEAGHIVTNNHVIAGATQVTVVFFNGIEAEAEVIGADSDSDLAVLRVAQLAEGAHMLPLADSAQVRVGEWVVAIGNPFQLGGSMSVGIVSAIGRTIPSGTTPFAIPQAIQTDAAINPGNSGGPLLNLRGEVIGVNAQILTGGNMANSGVGFAIPANVVRRVAPALIENGSYEWPWLGVQGGDVSLAVMEANNLETQLGAYITDVVPGGPAEEAGLRGTSRFQQVDGLEVPIGGDVVIEADGQTIIDFASLLIRTSFKNPGETMNLIILRDGQRQEVAVTLEPRPDNGSP
jgi:S1-C subfamily serine protease